MGTVTMEASTQKCQIVYGDGQYGRKSGTFGYKDYNMGRVVGTIGPHVSRDLVLQCRVVCAWTAFFLEVLWCGGVAMGLC